MKAVSNIEYWDKHWQGADFTIVSKRHPVRSWIEKNVENSNGKTCIEIGCYPGKFLAVFGEKGYKLNGIDYFKGTKILLPEWFNRKGYNVGNFYEKDIAEFKVSEKYDLVCSFGFIEHFKNWKDPLRKQIEMTASNGQLIVETPNLNSPIYRYLYKHFEPNILDNHEMGAMDLEKIKGFFEKNGLKVKEAGYVGHFFFRFVNRKDGIAKIIALLINMLRPLIDLLPQKMSARYIGVIATKE